MGNNYRYLKATMQRLANIVHNASQGDTVFRDEMLDSIIRIIEDFNSGISAEERVKITDYRR